MRKIGLVYLKNEINKIKKLTYNDLTIDMRVDWSLVSKYVQLPEYIIDKFSNKVDRYKISKHQSMTRTFVIEHINHIKKSKLMKNKKIKKNRDFCHGTGIQVKIKDNLLTKQSAKLYDVFILF